MARFFFPEWTQPLKKYVVTPALLLGPVYVVVLMWMITQNPSTLRIGYMPDQPVPYSHALHVGELGLDCRYCHNAVDVSNKAAIPPAATCMNCHQTVRPQSEKLLPVRQAFFENAPLNWVRVTDLPDYVYFNHSAHVTRGVGCESCHGRLDQMVKVYQAQSLTMRWCLDCHRNPTPNLRDPASVTVMGYKPRAGEGADVKTRLKINPPTDCSTCHR
jgi:hypothetical protein